MTTTCTTHSSSRALNPCWPGWHFRGQAEIGPTTLADPPTYDHWLKAAMTDNRQTARYPKSVCLCVCVSLFKVKKHQQCYHHLQSSVKLQPPAASTSEGEGMSKQRRALCSAKVTPASGALSQVNGCGRDPSRTSALFELSSESSRDRMMNSVKICIHSNIKMTSNILLCFVK